MRVRGDITPYVAKKNIINAFRSFIKKSPTPNGQDNITYSATSVNNNIVRVLMQAVGRICRTGKSNVSNVNIYVDSTIIDKVSFRFLIDEKRILNPEFEALVNKSNKKFDLKTYFDPIRNKTLEQDDRVNSLINNILGANRKSWSSEAIKDWKAVRSIVLKYPTISSEKLEEVAKEY